MLYIISLYEQKQLEKLIEFAEIKAKKDLTGRISILLVIPTEPLPDWTLLIETRERLIDTSNVDTYELEETESGKTLFRLYKNPIQQLTSPKVCRDNFSIGSIDQDHKLIQPIEIFKADKTTLINSQKASFPIWPHTIDGNKEPFIQFHTKLEYYTGDLKDYETNFLQSNVTIQVHKILESDYAGLLLSEDEEECLKQAMMTNRLNNFRCNFHLQRCQQNSFVYRDRLFDLCNSMISVAEDQQNTKSIQTNVRNSYSRFLHQLQPRVSPKQWSLLYESMLILKPNDMCQLEHHPLEKLILEAVQNPDSLDDKCGKVIKSIIKVAENTISDRARKILKTIPIITEGEDKSNDKDSLMQFTTEQRLFSIPQRQTQECNNEFLKLEASIREPLTSGSRQDNLLKLAAEMRDINRELEDTDHDQCRDSPKPS